MVERTVLAELKFRIGGIYPVWDKSTPVVGQHELQVKIGRGLDFFQRPDSWYEVGVSDLTFRKCLETKVDIYIKLR